MSKRIICWVGDAPNHRALVAKIALKHNVVGIVVDSKKNLNPSAGIGRLWGKFINKIRFAKIDNAWNQLQQHYRKEFPNWPDTTILRVDSINNTEVFDFTQQMKPDLIVVSGTSLIKEPLVSISPSIGIMNLHTGLSPYVKGGPNCTNWCIANDQWGLIGSTIMWLSSGIDSGNIIISKSTDTKNEKGLAAIHLKVMEHAHDLYLRAIDYVINSKPPYQSVPQSSLGKGNLYLTKMWTAAKKRQLLRNIASVRNTDSVAIKTIDLPA